MKYTKGLYLQRIGYSHNIVLNLNPFKLDRWYVDKETHFFEFVFTYIIVATLYLSDLVIYIVLTFIFYLCTYDICPIA
jgi:hypothetical protein